MQEPTSPNGPEAAQFSHPDKNARMPLWQHLDDLRKVLVRVLGALFIGAIGGYLICEPLVKFLERPFLKLLPPEEAHLYYLGVAEKFMVYFKVSLVAGILATSPYLLYQVWWFVAPALYKHERRFLVPFLCLGSVAFLMGSAFAFYVIIPSTYRFMISFGGSGGLPIIRLEQYFNLTLKLMFTTGLVFELPVLLVLLAKFGLLQPSSLVHYRRHAVLGLGILSAFISPTPDAFSMLIVWAPLWILYEMSVVAVGWASRQAVL